MTRGWPERVPRPKAAKLSKEELQRLRCLPLWDDVVSCGGCALKARLHQLIVKTPQREIHLPPAPEIVAVRCSSFTVKDPAAVQKDVFDE